MTTIRQIMPGKHPETEKEQVTFKGQGEAEPPTDFVTLGE